MTDNLTDQKAVCLQ